ncbi:MAG: dynamin family protein [Oscillospiraceae bacterium]
MEILNSDYQKEFDAFTGDAENVRKQLEPYGDIIKLSELDDVIRKFGIAAKEFTRKDRKLNIGVMGQVKAGKSSFLNTLLFDGRDVLPKAATPKTAALTKIEYSETNSIEIEYYSHEEWDSFKKSVAAESNSREDVAKEVLKLASKSGIDPEEYLSKGRETVEFDSYDRLMERLNDYVGENGRLTPFVKCVILHINNEEIKDISVVDTPGLNDPIVSRTVRTKDFMALCDVVFFLSGTSQFLSRSDLELLTVQLPSGGVRKLVLLGSRFDGAIQDCIEDCDSYEEAFAESEKTLKRSAVKNFSEFIKDQELRKGKENCVELANLLSSCKDPCFISSMAYNMSKKTPDRYSDEENVVFDNINQYGDLDDDTSEKLRKLGNIDRVREIFGGVIADKNKTLEERARKFVPVYRKQLSELLAQYSDSVRARCDMLSTQDKSEIEAQKKSVLSKKNAITADVETIFGDIAVRIEEEKVKTTAIIRDIKAECSSIEQHTETRTVENYVRVSDAKWYNPFSWGRHHYEDHSYTVQDVYLETADAVDNINRFSSSAQKNVEETFANAVNIRKVKTEILKSVISNFDTSDDSFDPNFFRTAVESTLSTIEFPVIHFDTDSIRDNAVGSFQSRVSDTSETSSLRLALSQSVSRIFDITIDKLISSVKDFKQNMLSIKEEVKEKLMGDIENEYNSILEQFSHKEEEIAKYQAAEKVLHSLMK